MLSMLAVTLSRSRRRDGGRRDVRITSRRRDRRKRRSGREREEGRGGGVGGNTVVHRLGKEKRRGELIHRGGRTRFHAAVERISPVSILDSSASRPASYASSTRKSRTRGTNFRTSARPSRARACACSIPSPIRAIRRGQCAFPAKREIPVPSDTPSVRFLDPSSIRIERYRAEFLCWKVRIRSYSRLLHN